MKLKAIMKTLMTAEGSEEVVWDVVDENGNPAKGMFTIKDGRPFDLLMNEYAD